jgi:thiol peroxidase
MAESVTMKGRPLTLAGSLPEVGSKAPPFTCLDRELKEVSLSQFRGRLKLISSVPSLDTPVCEMQTRRFNQEAEGLPPQVQPITVSMDLPFAQTRFCSMHGIERMLVLSDHRDASFGLAYGLLVKELRLLARAVLVLDEEDIIRHFQVVPELTEHPNYEAALAALSGLIRGGR